MLKIRKFEFNPLQENTYVLYDDTGECVIVDPGCYGKDEEEELDAFITSAGLKVKMLLNTHCHIDHILGNWHIKTKYGVKLYIHAKDEIVLRAAKVYAPSYGIHQYHETEADHFLSENEYVEFGNQKLKILFVPGHSPGHVAFYDQETRQLVSGDVLFYNSIGRTDLPGGDFDTLIRSIHHMIFTLPDETVVFPGHGPETSVGFEKATNPFCGIE